jgi:hypothetical protein
MPGHETGGPSKRSETLPLIGNNQGSMSPFSASTSSIFGLIRYLDNERYSLLQFIIWPRGPSGPADSICHVPPLLDANTLSTSYQHVIY